MTMLVCPYLAVRGAARAIEFYPVKFHLAVDNVDEMVQRAVDAGAILLRPVADEFYGERMGMVTDPFGFSWHISTTTGEVTPEEMQRRWNEALEVPK